MGLFTSFYGEIDCPSCGKQYRKRTPTLEEMRSRYASYRRTMSEPETDLLTHGLRPLWAKQEGFDSVDEWVSWINSDAWLEKQRHRPCWGLLEVQNKTLIKPYCQSYYPGDPIPDAPRGHLWDTGIIVCDCGADIDVWIEIRNGKYIGLSAEEPAPPLPKDRN